MSLSLIIAFAPGLVLAAAVPSQQQMLVVVQAKDSASKRAAQYMSYGFRDVLAKSDKYDLAPQGPLYGDREIDAKKLIKDAETAAQEGMTLYDNLETVEAQRKFEQALSVYEQNAGDFNSMKPAARYSLLAAAVALLNGNNEKLARTYMQRALLYDPNAQADPRVYNSQALGLFREVKAKMAKGQKGSLSVSTNPAYAELYVDGDFIGLAPDKIDRIDAGPHIVRVVRDGFRASSEVVDVKAGRNETSVTLNMIAMPQQQQVIGMLDKVATDIKAPTSPAASALASKGRVLYTLFSSVSVNGDQIKVQSAVFHQNNSRLAYAERTFSASMDTYREEAQQLWDVLSKDLAKASPDRPLVVEIDKRNERVTGGKTRLKPIVTGVLFGVGGASLIVGTVTGILALTESASFKRNAVQTNVADVTSRQGSIRGKALVSDITIGLGIASAAAGVLCLVLWDDRPKTQKLGMWNTLRFDAGVAANGAYFGAHGSF